MYGHNKPSDFAARCGPDRCHISNLPTDAIQVEIHNRPPCHALRHIYFDLLPLARALEDPIFQPGPSLISSTTLLGLGPNVEDW